MKLAFKIIYVFLSVIFLLYLFPSSTTFPSFPDGVLISDEPGDTQDPNIRSFFTDLDRREIMDYYTKEFRSNLFLGMGYPTYRLNYPPENAQEIIQDQLRSSFLEEIVHPFRESIYVSGFEPETEKDVIYINGINFERKITLRYVPSSVIFRLIIGLVTITLPPLIYLNLRDEVGVLFKKIFIKKKDNG